MRRSVGVEVHHEVRTFLTRRRVLADGLAEQGVPPGAREATGGSCKVVGNLVAGRAAAASVPGEGNSGAARGGLNDYCQSSPKRQRWDGSMVPALAFRACVVLVPALALRACVAWSRRWRSGLVWTVPRLTL